MAKRLRKPKPGEHLVQWGKPDRWSKESLVYSYGEGACRGTNRLVCEFFEGIKYDCGGPMTLAEHLEDRGYDLKTLRFSISKKALAGEG